MTTSLHRDHKNAKFMIDEEPFGVIDALPRLEPEGYFFIKAAFM